MWKGIDFSVGAVALVVIFAGQACGAPVRFQLVPQQKESGFELRADAGGSSGLAGYSVELEGVASFNHAVPSGIRKKGEESISAGFTIGNNDEKIEGPNLTDTNAIFAGQNTAGKEAPDNLIFGIGEEPSTASKENLISVPSLGIEPARTSWEAPITIGEGTALDGMPKFGSADATVFDNVGSIDVSKPTVNTEVVPEPGTLWLVAAASAGLLIRRRTKPIRHP